MGPQTRRVVQVVLHAWHVMQRKASTVVRVSVSRHLPVMRITAMDVVRTTPVLKSPRIQAVVLAALSARIVPWLEEHVVIITPANLPVVLKPVKDAVMHLANV